MMFSSDIFLNFSYYHTQRIPQTITKLNKYGAKPEDTTPTALSLIWTASVFFEMSLFIFVPCANKCQENILKILPLSIEEPIVFTMFCWLRGEESLLVWLHEVKLSKCRKLKSLFPPNE